MLRVEHPVSPVSKKKFMQYQRETKVDLDKGFNKSKMAAKIKLLQARNEKEISRFQARSSVASLSKVPSMEELNSDSKLPQLKNSNSKSNLFGYAWFMPNSFNQVYETKRKIK